MEKILEILGKTVEDKITGFKGVAITVAFDYPGCIQVVVSPKVGKDGKRNDAEFFDYHRLKVLSSKLPLPVPSFANYIEAPHGPAERPRNMGG